MYITQIVLNINNHLIFKDLTSIDAYHGWLETAFPSEQLLQIRKRHLWRLDNINKQPRILLVSEDQPDQAILSKYASSVETKDYQKFLDNLSLQKNYHFKLVADPIKCEHGRDIRLINRQQQFDWLFNKAKYNGFLVNSVQIVNTRKCRLRKHKFTVRQVAYEGFLQITDLNAFREALTQGLGRHKAYGVGLLTIM